MQDFLTLLMKVYILCCIFKIHKNVFTHYILGRGQIKQPAKGSFSKSLNLCCRDGAHFFKDIPSFGVLMMLVWMLK